MSFIPTAKGFVIWISFAIQAAFYHSVTRKPLGCRNNGSCMAVIKLLSEDFSPNAANPHKHWFFTVFCFIQTPDRQYGVLAKIVDFKPI